MKRFLTGIALSIALIAPLMAAESIDRSEPIQPDQRLRVEIPRGEVTLMASDDGQVSVQGSLDEDTESFEFASRGDEVVVILRLPSSMEKQWDDSGDRGARLTIRYPRNNALQYSTVSADTEANELGEIRMESVSGDFMLNSIQGRSQIETVSGDIEARNLTGEANLETVSGDVEGNLSGSALRVHTVSGDINLKSDASQVNLESVSGDIDARLSNVDQLRGGTVSGELTIELAQLDSGGEIALETVSGDISLRHQGAIDAQVTADTGPGGSIRNGWSDDEPSRGRYVSNENLDLRLGQGQARVRLNTVSGDLQLKK
ncbi:DUF4097 domain-containing protein [Ferrimonas balearica]|uniref:DUF4097 family beta strand repeat-containing protein n=1 Tax=Ferrimonas balearica TaxID=44012 RepID=UPI001C93ABED|nr:DUF4097 family beta strand repeat-containing protein [Ferrimonas balearica]MBY6107477.1 DUF4097 domain-containing protein [Ferrimonas balearica]